MWLTLPPQIPYTNGGNKTMKSLTESYSEETRETPFDHQGGFTYDFTIWVIKVVQRAIGELHDEGIMTEEIFNIKGVAVGEVEPTTTCVCGIHPVTGGNLYCDMCLADQDMRKYDKKE